MFVKIILIILGFSTLTCCSREKKNSNERTVSITIGNTEQKDVPIYIENIGNVYSLQTIDIRPQVGGIIEQAYVKQGQYVKAGDPLYQIDARPYEAALSKAKAILIKDTASLEFSKNQLERNKELVKKDYVSKLNFDQYKSNVEAGKGQIQSDQAEISLAELNLEWCTPRSPIDGKISQYNIDPGNLVVVNDQTALTTIRQIDPADIRFTITQKDFVEVQKAIKKGTLKFEVILPQAPETPREGTIYFIDNHIDQATGTILVKGTVRNDDELFWPGEFVRVRLNLRIAKNAILVPEEAIKIGQEGPYVYVYQPQNSTVEYRKIVKGEKFGQQFVVEQGVKFGEQVVVRGQINLLPGSKVKVIKSMDERPEDHL